MWLPFSFTIIFIMVSSQLLRVSRYQSVDICLQAAYARNARDESSNNGERMLLLHIALPSSSL